MVLGKGDCFLGGKLLKPSQRKCCFAQAILSVLKQNVLTTSVDVLNSERSYNGTKNPGISRLSKGKVVPTNNTNVVRDGGGVTTVRGGGGM